jgi:hypothetical protein
MSFNKYTTEELREFLNDMQGAIEETKQFFSASQLGELLRLISFVDEAGSDDNIVDCSLKYMAVAICVTLIQQELNRHQSASNE